MLNRLVKASSEESEDLDAARWLTLGWGRPKYLSGRGSAEWLPHRSSCAHSFGGFVREEVWGTYGKSPVWAGI